MVKQVPQTPGLPGPPRGLPTSITTWAGDLIRVLSGILAEISIRLNQMLAQDVVGGGLVTATGSTVARSLSDRFADTALASDFPGADAGLKIAAAMASLPTTGGLVDARMLEGAQSFSADPFLGVKKSITLLTGHATYTWDTESFTLKPGSGFNLVAFGTIFKPSSQGLGGVARLNGMFTTRTVATTGAITTGTATLTVADADQIDIGNIITVEGATGGDTKQQAVLDGAHNDSVTTITVVSTSGFWSAGGTVLIDSEMIQFTGLTGTTFTGATRGALGTTPASHSDLADVDWVPHMIREVTAVSGVTITVDSNATFTVSSAEVVTGAQNISFEGDLIIDGDQNRAGAKPSNNLEGIRIALGRYVHVGQRVQFKDIDHVGVTLSASRDCEIHGSYNRIGRPGDALGFDVLIFGKSKRNKVVTKGHLDGHISIGIDDRTTVVQDFDGPPQHNYVSMGPSPNSVHGLSLTGADLNSIDLSYINASNTAVTIATGQWTTNPIPVFNSISAKYLEGATAAINFAAGTASGANTIHALRAVGMVTVTAGNEVYLIDSGANRGHVFHGRVTLNERRLNNLDAGSFDINALDSSSVPIRFNRSGSTGPIQFFKGGTGTAAWIIDTAEGFIEGAEETAPSGPTANRGRLFFQDDGAGKTQLAVIFNTGIVQVIASEP